MLDIRPLFLLLALEPVLAVGLALPSPSTLRFFRSPTSPAFPGRLGTLFARRVFDINHDQRARTSVNPALYKLFEAPLSGRSLTNASALFLVQRSQNAFRIPFYPPLWSSDVLGLA
ncbi:hypothetical protein DFH06DRAFT_1480210 [Mycena polygramma]|nr:hypothetical protein DFH06DRAFT_1484528 [Mycena polygramma]KAJ7630135.1 hypothetical protein DFH06DRAFT_1480210 [Mycena polygramma]